MIIWIALIIPIPAVAVLYWKLQHRITLWEAAIMLGTPIFLTGLCKGCTEATQTHDTEYWGGYVTTAEYYEDWNERVSCSHPIYETITDSDGNTSTKYVGDEHAYDVDYHQEYWQINHSIGGSITISKATFDRLVGQFGNHAFVDLHRDYHSNDGDKYVATWKGEEDKLEPVAQTRSYENRVQASQSVFNFKEVDPKYYDLFEYPKIEGYVQRATLGAGTIADEKKFQFLNATLGAPKQVRAFTLVFKGKPMQAAMEQQAYWKGGNKNELVSCVGVNETMEVQWAYVFSWTDKEDIKAEARNFLMSQKTLDLSAYASWLGPAIQEKWIRKNFEEFSYLTVEPPMWSVLLTFFFTLLASGGVAAWAILNEHTPEGKRPSYDRWSS